MTRRITPLLILLLTCKLAHATGLRIAQLDVDSQGRICMEVGWAHAWHRSDGPGNHDAAWVFLKWRDAQGLWHPLPIAQAQASGNATAQASNDQFGCLVIPQQGLIDGEVLAQLCLGTALPDEAHEVRAYGIEMVQVPEGPYWLGDGASNRSFGDGQHSPLQISSEDLLPSTVLHDTSAYAPAGDIPAAWPKGFAEFHIMKHEISQAQYRDFLNTLTHTQQINLTTMPSETEEGTYAMGMPASNRNNIRVLTPGPIGGQASFCVDIDGDSPDGPEDGLHRACNGLNWQDLTAYLDWAGLRPLTEFEFEKACRGPLAARPLEFAWGTPQAIDANTVLQDGTDSETTAERGDSSRGPCAHGYAGPQGPLRGGFAAGPATTRVQAGASYYGAMELSGNLWELCVTVNAEGLAYTPIPGDGLLDTNGGAVQPTWPSHHGAGHRGGGWNSGVVPGFRDPAISDRFFAGLAPSLRRSTTGGRGCR